MNTPDPVSTPRRPARAAPSPFHGLGIRILLAMAVVSLGPLVVMAYQGYHCAREAVVESQAAHLGSVAASRRARLSSWLDEIRSRIDLLASFSCSMGGGRGGTGMEDGKGENSMPFGCNLFETLREHNCCFESAETFDPEWRPLAHSMLGPEDRLDGVPEAFREKLAGIEGFAVSPPWVDESGRIYVRIGQRLEDPAGGRPVYFLARLNLSAKVKEILGDTTGLGKTGKVYLLDGEGRILEDPGGRPDRMGTPAGVPAEMLRRARAAKEETRPSAGTPVSLPPVFEYEDDRGVPVLGSAQRVPGLSWIVVAEMDRDEAFAWLAVLRDRALVTGVITLAAVLLMAAFFAGRLSRPLRRLAITAQRIAEGAHGERLEPLPGAEAREVGDAFNRMLDRLAESHARLRHAESLAAVGALSTSIVHEMRNPLSSVKMNLQALRRKVEGDAAHAELAAIALEQAARLERMLTELLGYGKPLELRPAPVRFQALAADVEDAVRGEAEAREVRLAIEDHLGDRTFRADHEQLFRALVNLARNAIQASTPGGTVRITAQPSPSRPGEIEIAVADRGPGIDEARKEDVFRPFYTTREEGTGVGLANVKKIVDYHGGRVTVEDREGGGAVFTVHLPWEGPPA